MDGLSLAEADSVNDNVAGSRLAIVGGDAIRALISMREAVGVVRQAMQDLSAGVTLSPERWALPLGGRRLLGLMPGAHAGLGRFGAKVLSISGGASTAGRSSHQGLMALFDDGDGAPLCIIESGVLTALRTSAASAAATAELARPDANRIALLGTGEQADWHLAALAEIRPDARFVVWGRDPARAEAFSARYQAQGRTIEASPSAQSAVRDADIICTLTHSAEPVLEGAWLQPGQHINLVGASLRTAREADDEVVRRSRFIADSADHVRSQGGEYRHALQAGVIGEDHIVGEIGDVYGGRVAGRIARDDITLYKSLGHVVQDIAVADYIHARAKTSPLVMFADW